MSEAVGKPGEARALLFQKYTVRMGETTSEIEVARAGESYLARLDGRTVSLRWDESEPGRLNLEVDGRPLELRLTRQSDGTLRFEKQARQFAVRVEDDLSARARRAHPRQGEPVPLRSPMPGMVVKVLVEEGQTVSLEEPVLIIEAMKMQNELAAPAAGVIEGLSVKAGQAVNGDQVLLSVRA